jgi:hypothetical protein
MRGRQRVSPFTAGSSSKSITTWAAGGKGESKSVYGSEPRTRSYTHPKYATIHKLAGALDTGPIKLVRGPQDQHPLLVEDALRAKAVDGFSRPP